MTVFRVLGDRPDVELDLSVFNPGVDSAVGVFDALAPAPSLVEVVTTSTTVDDAGLLVG
jgi:hypothetical protein